MMSQLINAVIMHDSTIENSRLGLQRCWAGHWPERVEMSGDGGKVVCGYETLSNMRGRFTRGCRGIVSPMVSNH